MYAAQSAVLLLLLIISGPTFGANWLYLALSGVSAPQSSYEPELPGAQTRRSVNSICDHLVGLNDDQKQICLSHPFAMPSVSYGARDGIIECQWQFKFERWNCSMRRTENQSREDVFDNIFNMANRETAFISAITSAGIVHSITRGCSTGNLSECGCDNNYRGGESKHDDDSKWHWGGCSDNVRYGIKFSKQFLDKYEKEQHKTTKEVTNLMNMHNHEVGRQVVERHMQTQCRCHGVSGSCEFKTCWRSLPKFSQVGQILKTSYDRQAVRVARRAKKKLRRKEKADRKIQIRYNELVFVNRSPNYCVTDERMGIWGTRDRECNSTSFGSDSCDLLCCGRGYNKRIELRKERCKCKFVWCCYVKCKICEEKVEVHTCK